MRIGVHDFWMVLQLVVDGDHLPAHRSEELRTPALTDSIEPNDLASGDRSADLRKLDIHDVAKLLLGVIGRCRFRQSRR
jgi:hypothetical protein